MRACRPWTSTRRRRTSPILTPTLNSFADTEYPEAAKAVPSAYACLAMEDEVVAAAEEEAAADVPAVAEEVMAIEELAATVGVQGVQRGLCS